MPTVNQTSSVGSTASGTSVTPTFTNPVTSGNGIIVLFGLSTNNLSSVTDDKGNTYTSVRSQNFFGNHAAAIYYCSVTTNGPKVITVTTSANDGIAAVCLEVWGTLSLDTGNGQNANSATQTTGSFTTAASNTIAVASCRAGGQPSDNDTGWTEAAHAQQASLKFKTLTPSQTINPSWTTAVSQAYGAVGESFTSTSEGPSASDWDPSLKQRTFVTVPELPPPPVLKPKIPVSLLSGTVVVPGDWQPAYTPKRPKPTPDTPRPTIFRSSYPFDVRARPVVGPGLGLKREKIKRVPASSDPNFLNRLTSHAAQVASRLNSLVDRGRLFATGPANDQWEVRAKAHADTRDPGALDDEMAGFGVGDAWMNATTGKMFFCQDNTTNAAKWIGPIG